MAAPPPLAHLEARVAELAGGKTGDGATPHVRHELLDLGVGVELSDLLLENEIGPHAARGEVPDSRFVLGAVGVAVEVPHPRPARVFEQLDQKERALGIVAAEAQILVESSDLLPVQI